VTVATARLLHPDGSPVSAFSPRIPVDMAVRPHGDVIRDVGRDTLRAALAERAP
jgi:hypothetical protein